MYGHRPVLLVEGSAMDPKFKEAVESLHPKFEQLLAMPCVTAGNLPASAPQRGVYLFTESGNHLYIGRSNRIPQRYREHWNRGSRPNAAVFAIRLAREATGAAAGNYRPATQAAYQS